MHPIITMFIVMYSSQQASSYEETLKSSGIGPNLALGKHDLKLLKLNIGILLKKISRV